MKDPFLLEMTASDSLSLEDEYQMQQQWLDDEDKCIFIILAKDMCKNIPSDESQCKDIQSDQIQSSLQDFLSSNIHAMIGDVNLFLRNVIEDEEKEAELDIMIAEKNARRMGYATESVLLMMLYGSEELGIDRYFVKISEDNIESLKFFQKIGFRQCNYVECFREFELEWKSETRDETISFIKNKLGRGEKRKVDKMFEEM
jgi:RimJ/RimL family protein N-acetyltransferase